MSFSIFHYIQFVLISILWISFLGTNGNKIYFYRYRKVFKRFGWNNIFNKNLLVGNDLVITRIKRIIGMIVKKVYRNETMISIYRIFANGNMRFMLSDQYKKYIFKIL